MLSSQLHRRNQSDSISKIIHLGELSNLAKFHAFITSLNNLSDNSCTIMEKFVQHGGTEADRSPRAVSFFGGAVHSLLNARHSVKKW